MTAPKDDRCRPYTVIVVGSGCSRGLGVPTLDGFMDKVLEKANKDDHRKIRGFISEVRASSAYVKNRLLNIEEIYGLADMLSDDVGPKEQERGEAVKKALNRAIYRIASTAGEDFVKDEGKGRFNVGNLDEIKRESKAEQPLDMGKGTTRYSTLLAYLCMADYKDVVKGADRYPLFIQFNWDLALDRALYMRWMGDDLRWCPKKGTSTTLYDDVPRVARPHGAINWVEYTNQGQVSPDIQSCLDRKRAGAKLIEIYDLDDDGATEANSEPERRAEPQSAANANKTGPPPVVRIDQVPVFKPPDVCSTKLADLMAIVPPTWRKETRNPAFRRQWAMMKDGLENSRRIVFVGYSLPKSDLYFRHFLSLALRKNSFLPHVYVWNPAVGDPCSEAYQSYADTFEPLAREGRLLGLAAPFGDPAYLDLSRVLREATPMKVVS